MGKIRSLGYRRITKILWASVKNPHLLVLTLARRDASKIPNKVIRKFVDSSKIDFVIEAGCFDGKDTINLGKLFESADIHAFEPVSDIFDIAVKNTSHMKKLHINRLALIADSKSSVNMFSFNSTDVMHGSSSVMKPTTHLQIHPEVILNKVIEVPATTLAKYINDNNLSGNGLLWLDLQGAELEILSETPAVLQIIKAIYTEVSTQPLYEKSATIESLDAYLKEHHFRRVHLRVFLETGNALYIRNEKIE